MNFQIGPKNMSKLSGKSKRKNTDFSTVKCTMKIDKADHPYDAVNCVQRDDPRMCVVQAVSGKIWIQMTTNETPLLEFVHISVPNEIRGVVGRAGQ
jgi:hypothetical protein